MGGGRPGDVIRSLPLRECGLKVYITSAISALPAVTPLAGVWIESPAINELSDDDIVTPLAGVWIERLLRIIINLLVSSLPLRECGLKELLNHMSICLICVTPLAGVWIERKMIYRIIKHVQSLPLRECGLKDINYPQCIMIA